MLRRSISRKALHLGASRPMFEILRQANPDQNVFSWGKEASFLHKHQVHTADCWRMLSPAKKAELVEQGLSKEAFRILEETIQEDGVSSSKKVLILYGSQTGTAESYAKMMALMAQSHNFTPVVCSMNEGVEALTSGSNPPTTVLFVLSTYGVGEFPSNAERFHAALQSNDALRDAMRRIPYAIFGLGNSRNDNFNAAAKKLDVTLRSSGARSMMRMQLSCEMAPSGHEATFRTWKQNVWAALGHANAAGTPLGATYALHTCLGTKAEPTLEIPGFRHARVRNNRKLTPDNYNGSVNYLMTLRIAMDDQMDLLGGWKRRSDGRRANITDHIEILPHNPPAAVERACRLLNVDPTVVVEVAPLPGAAPSYIDGKKVLTRTLLTDVIDLCSAPARATLEALSQIATAPAEATKLEQMANDLSPDGQYETRSRQGCWTILDVLEECPSARPNLAQFLTHVPHIKPRTYSIARDNAQWHNDEFEILYNVPRRQRVGKAGDTQPGLCTGELEKLLSGATLTVRLTPSNIPLPSDEAPVVMIALGSGIGSCRSVLHHRRMLKQAGKTVGPVALFYGFRHAAQDQFFVDEFTEMEREGIVKVTYVASHDTPGKFITPMDVMDSSVGDFLGKKGEIMYCGLGGSVPVVVESALRRCGVDVASLRASKRYHEEYFSPDADTENLLRVDAPKSGETLAQKFSNCSMFCFQCEQTFQNRGCHKVGVCGKTPRVAALQDLTVHAVKILGHHLNAARLAGVKDSPALNRLTLFGLFTTLTNVNFDEARFVALLGELNKAISVARTLHKAGTPAGLAIPDTLPAVDQLVELGRSVGVLTRFGDAASQSGAGVSEMLMYALKGIAAYADHSLMNGKEDPTIYAFLHKALAFLASAQCTDLGQALALCIEAGKVNVTTMGLLYDSNTTLGIPSPHVVPIAPKPGKCILVSGHDLIILEGLLKLTEPLGINVYTHGEMLPAHSYPSLRKYKTLAGHYGGAWMRQAVEFPHFPGPILMTTNCLTEPHDTYRARIFTAGAVGWTGVPHVGNNMSDINFTSVIQAAQQAPGFTNEKAFTYADPVGVTRPASYTVGFGHKTIIDAAPVILDQIKKGNITRFFVVGGCDGFEGQRSYYTELVRKMPKTAVVLTVGCGKFRINHLDLGTIGDTGIPRILDVGQCNDSYSAVQVALALAGALNCQVSDLPLSIVLSWFEQKAIAVLLSCLALGLKPVHVGPSLPAFLTPEVLAVLVKDFGIRVCDDPEKDLQTMLAAKGAS